MTLAPDTLDFDCCTVPTCFDAASRDIADENVGANGDIAWSRPTSPDASDATHLVTLYGYDSAGNQSTVTDAKGILTQTDFNAVGRQTETIADFTTGTPTDSSDQTTAFTYDGDDDILTQTAVEPSGTPNQTTAYIYGTTSTSGIFSNTLLSKVEYPDATAGTASTSPSDDVSYIYDALGEKIGMTDQNGTTHAYTYDSLGRPILDAVTTLGTGVNGSVLALGVTYNAQGLPYLQTSYSDFAATAVVNQDQDAYNGLGQPTGEYQSVSGPVTTSTTPEVQYAYSTPGTGSVQTSMTYPNGRVLDYTYATGLDAAIGRVSGLADAVGSDVGNVQGYSYLGSGSIVGDVDGNGVTETTNLDNFGRTSELNYVNSSAVTTDDFQYGYDQDSNVLYQANGVNSTFSQLYSYDSLNRLIGYQQGAPNGTDTSITGTPTASQSWTYDALGNQDTVTTNGTATTNTTNSKNELSTSGGNSLAYDNDGNTLTDENGQTYTYNAWNQMVSAKNSGGTTLANYTYDAQGRRVTDAEYGITTDIYYSTKWQDIEERQGSIVIQQNVWGLGYVNQLVERDDDSASGNLGINGSGLGQSIFSQQDVNWTTTALTNGTGTIIQRFAASPYGVMTVLAPAWTPISDNYAWATLFQGGNFDKETGLMQFDKRDYSPEDGIWYEQDPLAYINSMDLYRFGDDNPEERVDPLGAAIVGKCKEISEYLSNENVKGYLLKHSSGDPDWGKFYGHMTTFDHSDLDSEILGSLIQSQQIFTVAPPGGVDQLSLQVLARHGVIDFASQKKYKFAALGNEANSKYWNITSNNEIQLKPGVNAFQAVNDVNATPNAYKLNCDNASQLTELGGIANAMGESNFNKAAAGASSIFSLVAHDHRPDFIPGDEGYIKNTEADSAQTAQGENGENIIYVGNHKYWGVFDEGNEYNTLDGWMDEVNSWNADEAGASLQDDKFRPKVGLKN